MWPRIACSVALLAAAWPASADARCPEKRRAETLARNAAAWVVETRRSDGEGEYRGTVWGCARREGRWRRIDRTASELPAYDRRLWQVRLRGTKVAYAVEDGDSRSDTRRFVVAYDVRRPGRKLSSVEPHGLWAEIARVRLARSGAVAFSVAEYVLRPGAPAPELTRRVYAGRGERVTVLDEDPEITLNSLRLERDRLTWRRDGVTRSATLR